MLKPKVAITIGDPAGIGPEIVFRAINSLAVQRVCSPVIFGDKAIINKYSKTNKFNIECVYSSNFNKKFKIGKPSKTSGLIAYKAIKEATRYCIKGLTKSLVTAPVSKESFKFAGVKVPGHTELLAELTNTKNYCMMMVCGKINSVMVTRHLPINAISKNLTKKNIISTIKTASDFIKLYIKNPKIIVCSLNPHGSDNGILGTEEKQIIIPAIKQLKKEKYNVTGPIPPDVAWARIRNKNYDLIVGMYHDQIMIPLKLINSQKIINVTAGLPFVRTSPGHGTAFDIAGKNIADESSMIEAIIFASKRL
ncbi:MAG: 4-hydroxythreonine-4-phosphate dehydrogenase PdxA [Candidatus Neomarinimicrobiota bacterium]